MAYYLNGASQDVIVILSSGTDTYKDVRLVDYKGLRYGRCNTAVAGQCRLLFRWALDYCLDGF